MFEKIKYLFRNHPLLVAALLITLIVYAPFLFYGHISWDDPEMVFKNNAVKSFDLIALISGRFVGNYIPVTMITHAFAWQLFGNFAGGHHLVNILLHLVNGLLVYQLGKALLRNETAAIAGALIFMLHPLQVESVGWIAELKNVLSTFFFLAGSLYYLKFRESRHQKHYLLTFAAFVLASLSKPSAIILPLVLICYDIIQLERFSIRFFYNKVPMLLTSIVLGIINIKTQTADQFINISHAFPYYERAGFAGFAFLNYLRLYILPVKLSVIYPFPEKSWLVMLAGYAFLLLMVATAFLLIRRNKLKVFSITCFIVLNLVLVLQFIPFGEVLYADRYQYVPLIGLAWITGLLLPVKVKNSRYILIVVISLLSVATFARISAWKSAVTLYTDILSKYPAEFVALNSAGVEYMRLNRDQEALDMFNRAIQSEPENYKSYYNRGLLYLKLGQPADAIESFDESLALFEYGKAYVGRATAWFMSGNLSRAMNDAELALGLDGQNPKAHYMLGNCYNDLNRLEEAKKAYDICITIDPGEADFYLKRAIVYGKLQDFRNCLEDLKICLELNPAHYEAWYWSGVAKVNLGMEACADFKNSAVQNFEPAVRAYNKYCSGSAAHR